MTANTKHPERHTNGRVGIRPACAADRDRGEQASTAFWRKQPWEYNSGI